MLTKDVSTLILRLNATLVYGARHDQATMSPTQQDARASRTADLAIVVALIVLPPAIYSLAAWILAAADGASVATVCCFDPSATVPATAVNVALRCTMAAGGIAFLFAAPCLLGIIFFRAFPARRATAHVYSVCVNSLALPTVCLILRESVGITRPSFVAGWLVWSIGLAALAVMRGRPGDEIRQLLARYGWELTIAVAAAVTGIAVFAPEQFVQCLNGDGDETFSLAASLQHHFLPSWEIETTGQFGAVVVNPSFLNSYWTFALQTLLGGNELATRISFWVYWAAVLLVCARLMRQAGPRSFSALLCLALSLWLVALWCLFYTGYYPYMADLANPGVVDALFTLYLFLGFDALRQRDGSGWILAMVCASLVLYAGPVIFVLTIIAVGIWQPIPRTALLRHALVGGCALVGIAGAYVAWGWSQGILAGWWSTINTEYVVEYVQQGYRVYPGLLFGGYFLLGSGGLPAFSLLLAFRHSPWQKTVATVTLAYLAIVLTSASKNLHYLVPLLSVGVLLWNLQFAGSTSTAGIWNRARAARGLAVLSMSFCVWLCWPNARPVFTLNRELGAATSFQTDSYETACRWARLVNYVDNSILYEIEAIHWMVGPHNWVRYSQLEENADSPRPVLITNQPAPPGYQILFESKDALDGVKVMYRGTEFRDWAAGQHPAESAERFPEVFAPIALLPAPTAAAVSRDAKSTPAKP